MQILPHAKVPLRGDDGGVAERKLDLLERCVTFVGQLRERAPKVVRDVAEFTESPFEHTFDLPADAPTGSSVNVGATATDAAGNTTSATALSLEVLAGGFVVGEVYDASKGVPLAGATVTHSLGTLTSDALGRFRFFTEEATVVVLVEVDGYTSAERVSLVDSLQGTVLLDARLTQVEDATTVGASGGTIASGSFELDIPGGALGADTDLTVTEVPSHGLKGPLPLGWSPLGAVEIGPAGISFSIDSSLKLNADEIAGLSLVLVRYDETLHSWAVEAEGLTGDTFMSSPISSTGAYAFLVADGGSTVPPAAVVGEALLGAEPVEVTFGLSATSEVVPEAAPVSPDVQAKGSVVLYSPLALPSGTVVSARVEERFESFVEGELLTEPFTQEIPLYRFPQRVDGELHADFPVTPSRELTVEEIQEGVIHVEITTAPLFVQGALVGSEGSIVRGDGDAELLIPAGALTETVAVSADALDPYTVGVGFEGYSALAAAEAELGGASLSLGGTLSLPTVDLASTENLFAAKFIYISGQRKLKLLGIASYADQRLSFSGLDSSGTYIFFQSVEPLAFVEGLVREGGSPAAMAVVESSTAPFSDVTSADGAYRVAAVLDQTTLTARSLQSGNIGSVVIAPATPDPVTALPH